MSVSIRLRREGSKDRPFYRIVAADKRFRRDGRYIEQLGHYNPMDKAADNFELNLEKAEKWVSLGAQPSETVRSLMVKARQKAKTTAKAS